MTVYENANGYVTKEATGKSESYIVYRHRGTAAVKVATFGTSIPNALDRAKAKLDEPDKQPHRWM